MHMEPVLKNNLNTNVRIAMNNYVRSLDYDRNSKLPSELEIAKSLNVSRATLRRTLDEMEQEGTIIRIHGKGTFVNPEAMRIKLNLSPGYEFEKMIRKSGFASNVKVIRFEVESASAEVADKLRIAAGASIYLLEKAYFADGHLAIISIDRFPCFLFSEVEGLTEEESIESIFDVLRRKAGKIVERDRIEIESLSRIEIRKYSGFSENMECASCLVFHGINYDQDNKPVIYDTELYDTNYVQFNVIRRKTLFD